LWYNKGDEIGFYEKRKMRYEVYHDESKEESFWHIFLFIPEGMKEEFFQFLREARSNHNFDSGEMHFSSSRFTSFAVFNCANSWLSILLSAFQQKNGSMEKFWLGAPSYHIPSFSTEELEQLEKCFSRIPQIKVAIFRQEENHNDMTGHPDELSKIETTFRMGLQGACSYLFDQDHPVEISRIILDGERHYRRAYGREFDKEKVLRKLDSNFRLYCSLSTDCIINGEELDRVECEFSQVADFVLGIFRAGIVRPKFSNCNNQNEQRKYKICKKLKEFFDEKINLGSVRMRNSRFENFGTFSSARIDENEKWIFENIAPKFLTNTQAEIPSLFEI